MLVIAVGFDELEAASLVKGAKHFVFIDHQKTHFGASIGGGTVAAMRNECLANATVLILGKDRKALEDIVFFVVFEILLKLDASDERLTHPRTVDVRAASLFGIQLLDCQKSRTGRVIFTGKPEALTVNSKRFMDRFKAG